MCRIHKDRPAVPGRTYCQTCLDTRAAMARLRYKAERGHSEITRVYTCTICGGRGHSKRTCPKRHEQSTDA